jgi:hypothetical protein
MSKAKQISLERHTLDLRQRTFTRVKHGFEVIGTWYQTADTRWRWQACLVLLPAIKWPGRKLTPVIIPQTEAWRWAMHGDVGDPEHCFQKAAVWFDEGCLPGTPFDKRDHMKLYDAINESLPDLIAMPPRPQGDKVAVADIIIRRETGEIIEREIHNDV